MRDGPGLVLSPISHPRDASGDSAPDAPSARPVASMPPSPPLPPRLNPSLPVPELRPPVHHLLRRPPAPVQAPVAASASRPGLHDQLRPFDADHRQAEVVCPSPRVAAPPEGARQCGSASRRGTRRLPSTRIDEYPLVARNSDAYEELLRQEAEEGNPEELETESVELEQQQEKNEELQHQPEFGAQSPPRRRTRYSTLGYHTTIDP
nr:unnamed protein product [Digitaria exilis]